MRSAAGSAPFCAAPDQALATLQRDCDGGDLPSCSRLAPLETYRPPAERSREREIKLLTKACDGHYAVACTRRLRFREGCKYGDPQACFMLGTESNSDKPYASAMFEKACNGGDSSGCSWLAHSAFDVRSSSYRDYARSLELLKRSCELWPSDDCTSIAVAYARVAKDYPYAASFFTMACDTSDGRKACAALAEFYAKGIGVPRDLARARMFNHKACQRGHMPACLRSYP
jgi:uncharacterized protein